MNVLFTYTNKGFTTSQRKFHPMEGECEEFLHTFTIKICTHKKPGWKWNYYVVVV